MSSSWFVDYQQPIGLKNDYRTSSYRAHKYYDDTMLTHPTKTSKVECSAYNTKQPMGSELISEQREHYTAKLNDPDLLRNPPIKNTALKCMKIYEETSFRQPPRRLEQLRSIYNKDFTVLPQSVSEQPPKLPFQTGVKPCDGVEIDRTKPCFSKYLDTKATTMRLDYPHYTNEQKFGICANDQITYWTWIQYGSHEKKSVWPVQEHCCEKVSSSKCPKRRREFRNSCQAVPHAGLTTESRSNYVKPLNKIELKHIEIPNRIISCDLAPIQKRTENSIYGSREPLNKFVDTCKRNICL